MYQEPILLVVAFPPVLSCTVRCRVEFVSCDLNLVVTLFLKEFERYFCKKLIQKLFVHSRESELSHTSADISNAQQF